MRYNLRPNLSYCVIDGQAIFLDIDEDRYFRLDGSLQDAFLAYVNAEGGNASCVGALVDRGILVPGSATDHHPDRIQPVSRSALELDTGSGPVGIVAILRVLAIVWRMRRQLARQRFKVVLDELVLYREMCQRHGTTPSCEAQTLDAARLFNRCRLYVPVSTSCLLDSLAMTRYLAANGITANIVIGVTRDPFAAHCWVQYGDVVLNDTVGNVTAHTPIRVI